MTNSKMSKLKAAMGAPLEDLKGQVRLAWRKLMWLLRIDTDLMAHNHNHTVSEFFFKWLLTIERNNYKKPHSVSNLLYIYHIGRNSGKKAVTFYVPI